MDGDYFPEPKTVVGIKSCGSQERTVHTVICVSVSFKQRYYLDVKTDSMFSFWTSC